MKRLKLTNDVFWFVTESKQPTGYKTINILLSKLNEHKARNKISQITHGGVCYVNSHFRTQTKKKRRKTHASH